MKSYPKDTSANALVLNEFGEAYISEQGDNHLILEYHIKIKILKSQGLSEGDFSIPLYKDGLTKQSVREIVASTFNLEGNRISETKIDRTSQFDESYNNHLDFKKFTLLKVQVGSVIEIKYILESPYIFNFWPWKFQSDLPKIRSEFWARIPANYVYNITLQGYLNLAKNESSILNDCFAPGGALKADCVWLKYTMEDVPAFLEEDFMTSKDDYLSGINFELSQIKYFDGRIDNYTRSWPDVDIELRTHEDYGVQIKKATHILKDQVNSIVSLESDPLKKAKLIYDFVQNWYTWNENTGKYAELGVKKAFEMRKGNAGDINLSLVAALQSVGLNADPVMLSTRENGLPHELHPVMSDFNYTIAHLNLGQTKILLDATEKLLPFGLLPERCLNGKGRLTSKKTEESGWVELKPIEKRKKLFSINLKLDEGKSLHGDLTITSYGYEAFDRRVELVNYANAKTNHEKLNIQSEAILLTDYTVENLEDISKPLVEKIKIEYDLEVLDPSTIYLNPFIIERLETNPLKSSERHFPVDFGAPLETTYMLNLEYSSSYKVDEMPFNVALWLPNKGGRFILSLTNLNNTITMTTIISLSKSVYSPEEYHSLRELYIQMVQIHQSQIVLKKP